MHPLRNTTIVGAGTMGHGIGQEFARAGFDVVLHARTAETLQRAQEQIQRNLCELSGWGLVLAAEIQPTVGRIRSTTVLEEAVARENHGNGSFPDLPEKIPDRDDDFFFLPRPVPLRLLPVIALEHIHDNNRGFHFFSPKRRG